MTTLVSWCRVQVILGFNPIADDFRNRPGFPQGDVNFDFVYPTDLIAMLDLLSKEEQAAAFDSFCAYLTLLDGLKPSAVDAIARWVVHIEDTGKLLEAFPSVFVQE